MTTFYLHAIIVMTTIEQGLPLEIGHRIPKGMWYILALRIATPNTLVEVFLVPRFGLYLLVGVLSIFDGVFVGTPGVEEPADDPLDWIADQINVNGLGQVELVEIQPVYVLYVHGALFQFRHILRRLASLFLVHLAESFCSKTRLFQGQVIVECLQGHEKLQH